MGASKQNLAAITLSGRGRFGPEELTRAEADRGVHFAIAVERLRGWPVHATHVGEEVVRYQAESGGDQIYDPRGILTSARFSVVIVVPLARSRRDWPADAFQDGHLRLGTKCVGEEGLAEQGLIDEPAIQQAIELLRSNPVYVGLIPDRPHPRLPAKALTRYSWRGCTFYAEALSRATGLPAANMLVDQLVPGWS